MLSWKNVPLNTILLALASKCKASPTPFWCYIEVTYHNSVFTLSDYERRNYCACRIRLCVYARGCALHFSTTINFHFSNNAASLHFAAISARCHSHTQTTKQQQLIHSKCQKLNKLVDLSESEFMLSISVHCF